mgnify:CR=1 FL=1
MRKIVFGFCALTVATWLLNLGFNPPAMNGRSLTHEVFFLNGVLAWGLMAMAIVIAGLFIGSSVVYYARIEPVVLGIPIIGFVGYVSALVLALMLGRNIWRNSHGGKH